MANAISYVSKYAPDLDKMIVQESKTGFMADGAFKARFTGARTVLLPELDFDGLGDYDRVDGYSKGGITLKHTPYTLSMERSKQLNIDAQDADESGVPGLVGKTVGEYTKQKVNPEIDAYVLSTLYGIAKEKGNTKVYAAGTAVADLLAQINACEAANGYTNEQMVAFVNPDLYAALMTSNELQRSIITSEFKQGEIDLKVKYINNCAIIPVAADRMKSGYEFGDTGHTPLADATDISAIIMPKSAASLVKKVDKVDTYTPEQVQDMDAYRINFRLYYDCFVTNQKKGVIFAIG